MVLIQLLLPTTCAARADGLASLAERRRTLRTRCPSGLARKPFTASCRYEQIEPFLRTDRGQQRGTVGHGQLEPDARRGPEEFAHDRQGGSGSCIKLV